MDNGEIIKMSYIDNFNHQEVGIVSGIQVYLAKQDITGEDFQCKENQFIIGGGGGEHPAMVVNNINQAVITYLIFIKNDEEIDLFCLDNDEYDFHYLDNLTHFFWTIKDFVNFYESSKSEGYSEYSDYQVEAWIAAKVGDLAFRNFPELIDSAILKIANKYLKDVNL